MFQKLHPITQVNFSAVDAVAEGVSQHNTPQTTNAQEPALKKSTKRTPPTPPPTDDGGAIPSILPAKHKETVVTQDEPTSNIKPRTINVLAHSGIHKSENNVITKLLLVDKDVIGAPVEPKLDPNASIEAVLLHEIRQVILLIFYVINTITNDAIASS